jgi:predicted Zn-dependent protease
MNNRIFILLLCLAAGISTRAQDPVFNTLKSELDRNFAVLKSQPIPAYYIFLRVDEIQGATCVGRLGRLQASVKRDVPSHILTSCLRVGDKTLDNTHEIREGEGGYRDVKMEGQYIPIDNNPQVLKNAIWQQLDNLYKDDIRIYEQVKANIAVKVEQEDKSPDFSTETAEKYYENPITWESLGIDNKTWEDKVRRYSAVFDANKDILDGSAILSANLQRKIFVDTEGREIAQNSVVFQLALTAETLADDGMSLPLYKTWMSFSLAELPSDEEVLAAAAEISKTLSALKKAPVVESFTGPAILSPEAAGVFFHEIFGHRIEGSRLKQENDAQTFKKKIGENVLPKHLSVTLDPTLRYFGKTALNGYYIFDDEGVRGQKVEVVKNGVLKDFLMSRTPIEGFLHSNGHGRAQVGAAPVSRQSNLLVESSQKLSREELLKRLRKEAKAQGKEYAYYFKDVSGGFTTTNRYMPNSFNVTPLVVYRIYTDGRPDELVRGVDLVGTPLAMFAQIVACGNEQAVFNGTCGAESGGVPVSAISPALLVKQIETQKRAKSQSQPPILSEPEAEGFSESGDKTDSDIIHESIKREVERGLAGLRMSGLAAPFFISYNLNDFKQISISATNGSLIASNQSVRRGGGARLLIGDYKCTDENFQGNTSGNTGFDGSPCLDNDEAGIRYTVWLDLDAIYKNAAETYEQKLSAIKQLNIPEKDLELPDWDKTPTVVMNDIPVPENKIDRKALEQYAKDVSSVFSEYRELFDSEVNIIVLEGMNYFYNTEKSSFRKPEFILKVIASVHTQTEEGEDITDNFDLTFGSISDLPPTDEMKTKCRELAKRILDEAKAPKIAESYTGPILFENLAVVRTFYSSFFNNISLAAHRKPFNAQGYSSGGNSLEEMLGKRITAKEITIEDLTGTPEYNGVKLLGYTPIDDQAVITPEKLTLVENGILKNLLSDRVPTEKVPHSNGHALASGMGGSASTGVVRMIDTRTKSKQELHRELFRLAKEEGYDYAYVVKNSYGGGYPRELYKIYADGREERVRSASINDFDEQVFKKIVAVSDKELIYNGTINNLQSVIVPDAILFYDLQIRSDRVDNLRKPPVVEKEN